MGAGWVSPEGCEEKVYTSPLLRSGLEDGLELTCVRVTSSSKDTSPFWTRTHPRDLTLT